MSGKRQSKHVMSGKRQSKHVMSGKRQSESAQEYNRLQRHAHMTLTIPRNLQEAIRAYARRRNTFCRYVVELALVEFLNRNQEPGDTQLQLTPKPLKQRIDREEY